MKGRPDDWTHIVRNNWKKVTAYVVSSTHPSFLKMAKDEVAHVERVMKWVLLDDVTKLRPKAHWFMAVVVCPGDDLEALTAWAARKQADRIHFYLHRDADAEAPPLGETLGCRWRASSRNASRRTKGCTRSWVLT